MPPSENLGRIRLTLDNIHNDMSKEIHQIPPIYDEGQRKLNLWTVWKISSLCSAGIHSIFAMWSLFDVRRAPYDRYPPELIYCMVALSILFWIYGTLFNHPSLSYHMFGCYLIVICYYHLVIANDLIIFLFGSSARDYFESGLEHIGFVVALILIAVVSFPYPVMRIYQWWTRKNALPLDDEFPRTIEEVPPKTIYYI